jgi:mannose-1-phosphate guanylyltransferase
MVVMAAARVFPLIMAGGASSRLWPASDRAKPKWGLRLFGGQSLLEQAWQRARAVAPAADCFVAAGVAQAALVRRELPELPRRNLLLEPQPRDTAGAIALAAAAIAGRTGVSPHKPARKHPVMLVLPGDHIIQPLARFRQCVLTGARAATELKALVTFGIVPRKAATAYGYVHCGPEIKLAGAAGALPARPRVFRAWGFREKPDQQTAEEYVSSGDYYWNGGIFLWELDTLLTEFERQLPGHAAFVRTLSAVSPAAGAWNAALRAQFPALKKISIDFGVMEHAKTVVTVAADFEWDDIGSWSAVGEHLDGSSGNALAPGGDVLAVNAHGNVVFAPGRRVALVGVEGLAVVACGGDILVCRLDRDQDVREASAAAAQRAETKSSRPAKRRA